MARTHRIFGSVSISLLIVASVAACLGDPSLTPCSEKKTCPEHMTCRSGRCFYEVPPWTVPPCSSPAASGRCCDMDPAMIPADDDDCRLLLLEDAVAISAPARTLDGDIVVSVVDDQGLSIAALRPDGTEVWREALGEAPAGAPPTVRVAADGAVYADRGDALWARRLGGMIDTLSAGGTIDGGFAVCRGGVAVALVRGPEGRGPVRLDRGPGAWPLSRSLDVEPALPPAISVLDAAIATAWMGGTVTVHDLDSGVLRGVWPDAETGPEITGLALDGEGSLWVSTAAGTLEMLPTSMESMGDHIIVTLGSPIWTPPVIPEAGAVLVALGDGRIVRGDDANHPTPKAMETLVTKAPGTLALLEGDGYQLLGECPGGRCLSVITYEPTSYSVEIFDSIGEHRHSGLPADAAVGLPGSEGLAALAAEGRLEGLVVAVPLRRNVPWPGPDGGPGNGRCAEDRE